MDDIVPRVAVLEQIARSTEASLARIERTIETGFSRSETRMDRLEAGMDRLDTKVDRLEARQHADFRWLLGTMLTGVGATLTGFVAILGLMAHGFKWIG
jgi:hypothetical protein